MKVNKGLDLGEATVLNDINHELYMLAVFVCRDKEQLDEYRNNGASRHSLFLSTKKVREQEEKIQEMLRENSSLLNCWIHLDGTTLLSNSMKIQYSEVGRELLLKAGADPDVTDCIGHTSLHRASYPFTRSSVCSVELLLDYNADASITDPFGRTALYYVREAYEQSLQSQNNAFIKSCEKVIILLEAAEQKK